MNGDIYIGRKKGTDTWEVELHASYQQKEFKSLPDPFKIALGMIAGGHTGIGTKLPPDQYHADRHQDVYKIAVTPELLKYWFELGEAGTSTEA